LVHDGAHQFASLEEAGVRHLFSVPGDYNLELLQQLQDTGTPKWIGTCSELNASMRRTAMRG
jgi:TPP-dependent 2-oxoacid decarboxylase